MNKLKKLIISIICCCLLLSGMAVNTYAAEGSIMFSDPETAVGDTVEIKCAISASDTISGINLTLSYDSDSLRFESGDGVTKSQDGTLTYTGEGGSTEASFTMTFQALKEGSASVSVASSSVTASDGTEVALEEGNSTVTIAEGDPSKIKSEEKTEASGDGVKIEIDGKSYELSSNFADQDIPEGFKKTTVKYEGSDRTMVTNDSESIYLAYLLDSDGLGDFYYYDSSKAKFTMYEQVKISDDSSIMVLNETEGVSVPGAYETTTLTLNDKEFSIWQNPKEADYYILYAIGPDGEKGFYRYDSKEGTYQRYEMPAESDNTTSADSKASKAKGIFGKLRNLIDHYFSAFIVIVGVVLLLLIIRLIVVRIKLRNRDLELDDLYDEYGIDLEDEEDEELLAPKKKKNAKNNKKNPKIQKNGPAVRKPQKTAQFDFEEDYDDYGELDYEDDYDEDDFEDIDSFEDDYDYEDEYDYDEDEYEEDDMIDDLDELLSEQPRKRRSHMEEDDTFKIDFVDLD